MIKIANLTQIAMKMRKYKMVFFSGLATHIDPHRLALKKLSVN